MLEEVRAGLSRPQKELPPKFFYDLRGSELFEKITQLPEYYLSRTERVLLERWMPEWIAEARPRSLLELGAGSAAKTRIILDAMRTGGTAEVYVPIDVSALFLQQVSEDLDREYPRLEVVPVVADITTELPLPDELPHPVLYSFLGGTIGNFDPEAALHLLRRVRGVMQLPDRFLMGVDLRKDPVRIEAAYNDAQGVTAEFNRNMLQVLNRELGADFDLSAFRHHAFYNRDCHCIEMHLVAERPQRVSIPGIGSFELREGESLRTEISCKHDRESVAALFTAAGLRSERWETDAEELFAIVLAAPVASPAP